MSPRLHPMSLATTEHFVLSIKKIGFFSSDRASKLPCPLLMIMSAALYIFRNSLEHKDNTVPDALEPEDTMVAILSIPHW